MSRKKTYGFEDGALTRDETLLDAARPHLQQAAAWLRGNAPSLKQSYASIFMSIVTGLLAGLFLGQSEELLTMLPGLVVLVPAALGMRGNIFAALGSRLGSALHMGTVTGLDRRNPVIRNNIYASMALTVIFSVFLGLLSKAVLLLFGFESISVVDLILISFIGGILSGIIMLFVAVGITFLAFRKGWDPDNVTSPMITAFGDLFTVPTLMAGAVIVMNSHLSSSLSVLIIALGIALLVFFDIFTVETREQSLLLREASYRQIVLQSSAILLFTLALDSFSGVIIQLNLPALVAMPVLLVIIPVFLEEGGNVGNIMASRLSTKLHLGAVEPRLALSREIRLEILNAYFLAVLIFISVGVLAYMFSAAAGIATLGFLQILALTFAAGMLLTTIVVFVTLFVSVVSYRLKIDPDNVSIPVITSVADVLGILCLLLVLNASAVI